MPSRKVLRLKEFLAASDFFFLKQFQELFVKCLTSELQIRANVTLLTKVELKLLHVINRSNSLKSRTSCRIPQTRNSLQEFKSKKIFIYLNILSWNFLTDTHPLYYVLASAQLINDEYFSSASQFKHAVTAYDVTWTSPPLFFLIRKHLSMCLRTF